MVSPLHEFMDSLILRLRDREPRISAPLHCRRSELEEKIGRNPQVIGRMIKTLNGKSPQNVDGLEKPKSCSLNQLPLKFQKLRADNISLTMTRMIKETEQGIMRS